VDQYTRVVDDEEEEGLFAITTAITQTSILIYPTSKYITVTNSNKLAKTESQKQSL